MRFSVIAPLKRLGAVWVVAAISAALVVSSCSRRVMADEEAERWVAAYTPAHIDREARIRLELTDLTRSKVDTARSLKGVFSFSPRLKGEAVYSPDRRFIEFIPEEAMEQGRNYKCRVDMRALTEVDSLADFAFDFYVDKREMRFDDVTVTVDPDNVALMTVRGRLVYSVPAGDSITADTTLLRCDYPGVRITMDPKPDKQTRGFRITGIKRGEKETALTLSLNSLAGFAAEDRKITIPAISGFTLLSSERVEAPEPYLNLEFSTPLSSQQELDGLITIDNLPDIKIERSGTNVKVYYPRNGIKNLTLRVSDLLKNNDGRSLDEELVCHFHQEVIPPTIKLPFEGSILPDSRNLKLPFRAVNLAAVDVEVVKIFPSNVISFLQTNDLSETWTLRRYGRLIYHQTVRLDRDKSLNLHQWQDFSIDLKDLFARERGAIYNIRLTFRKAYSLYNRAKPEDFEEIKGITDDDRKTWDKNDPYLFRATPDYCWEKLNWNETDDPTKDSYYMYEYDRMPEVNLVASNIGLIVKRGDDNLLRTIVTDIVEARPLAGVTVTAYDFQMQKVGSARSDENGFADIRADHNPFWVTASDGRSTTYLKVTNYNELSLSNFDVAGKTYNGGIKGFTYGDRGVWRPGDDIHLTLIVEDKQKALPDNHPVVMELYNPAEQIYERQVIEKGVDGFYVCHIPTDESAPTGLWTAKFSIGNQTFYHPVRIETIKPNRLKVNIEAPEVIQGNAKNDFRLDARWLSGPVAKNMRVSVDMNLFTNPNPFEKYKNYTFRNPLVEYTSTESTLFTGQTDSVGHLIRRCAIGADLNSPGMLMANLTAKVTEPGGDASIVSKSVPFSPFGVYVGLDMRKKEFLTDEEIALPVVVVNQKGARMKSRELEYKIYRLDWDWWWEGSADDLSRYVKSTSAEVVASGTLTAENGFATLRFTVQYPEWGRYLILLRDSKGGHATGGILNIDWPNWRGRSNKASASGSTELSFTLDKRQYEVGETAKVYLPKCPGGRVLLSIENGDRVIKRLWATLSGTEETGFALPVDASMAPNFYVTATMLRPHKETDFNTPIRLYGVRSVKVINPRSVLNPLIEMPDELHPQQPFTVRVREKEGRPMTYTLAIVDEGLLDITNFKTPRPWEAMNRKEALKVRTWDMFDNIIGAFGSNFRSIHSVGGDEALRTAAGKEKRFNPAVKFLGPFTLTGGAQSHRITLPNYVGSVRVMVVAAHDGNYGSADKTVPVTSPLMMLSTLPRALANCDTVEMPVNIFAMKPEIKNVSVNIDVTGPVKVLEPESKSILFKEAGEQLTSFRLACDKSVEGKARIILTAAANGHTTRDTTFIEVSNPMPTLYETVERTLGANSSTEFTLPKGGSESLSLQVGAMPSMNFSGVASFLEGYPHYCTEQLSSKALFTLFGRKFLDDETRVRLEGQLPALLKRIRGRQSGNGGFRYWPGSAEEDEWVTSMVGIVLTEAARQGFRVDKQCVDKWKTYQEARARNYQYTLESDLNQAFRIYSLTVAGATPTAAMNRLRESKQLSQTAAFALAAAYAEAGRKDVALKLIERANRTESTRSNDAFYSKLRNKTIELEALTLCDLRPEALRMAREVAADCSGNYVTQEVAFATVAFNRLSALLGSGANSLRVSPKGQTPVCLNGFRDVKNIALNPSTESLKVENLNPRGALELSLLSARRPSADETLKASAKGLKLTVRYTDLSHKPIAVTDLRQDSEFYAEVTVTNLGRDVENMALTYAIPAGWEIWNGRLYGSAGPDSDNEDIRDTACNFYFPLRRGASKTVRVRLRAAYPGNFILPPTVCEDMYNPGCRAVTANRRVTVKP